MRFYELVVRDPATGQNIVLAPGGLGFTRGSGPLATSLQTSVTTSNPRLVGTANPGALNVEFDLPTGPMHVLESNALIKIWGLGIQTISQAWNLNPVNNVFKTFSLRGGMSRGLPLANPAQQGLLAEGIVWNAYGSWTGTEQVLNLVVEPFLNTVNAAVSLNWAKGQDLRAALAQIFAQAAPQYTPSINITADLTAPSPQQGYYPGSSGFSVFARWLNDFTRELGGRTYGEDYPGVMIVPDGKKLYAFDFQPPTGKTHALDFQDLLGQPTWIQANTIFFQTVLRGDIKFGDKITFPVGVLPPYVLQIPDPHVSYPNSPAASRTTFAGTFAVNNWIEHFGNFRQADASAWNTAFRVTFPGAQTIPN